MSITAPDKTSAIVAYGPAKAGQWKLEPVVPRALNDDEVLVRIVASGICPADLHFGDVPTDEAVGIPGIWYPRVFGHEGSGYIEQVGGAVTSVKPSDPILLSFMSCGECYNCHDAHPAYCRHFFDHNFPGERGIYASHDARYLDIGGSFFGQSSFSSRAIVKERCVVNVAGANVSEEELRILAPLGCGVQTGTGAFINVADIQAGQEVAVVGVGDFGQSAVMAALIRGCKTIIAIDRSSSRLELAKSLGATHVINTSDAMIDLVSEVKKTTHDRGVHVSMDTTGVQPLARQSWDFVCNRGKILQVGLAKSGDNWNVSMADHMNSGKQIIGCVEGDAVPQKYVLEMIQWFRRGKLPLDKIVSFYTVGEYQQALEDMREGKVVKPVLLWSRDSSS